MSRLPHGGPWPRHLLADPDPVRFLDAFFELATQRIDLLLADPGLPPGALQELVEREGACLVGNRDGASLRRASGAYPFPDNFGSSEPPARIFVPTGGTTGVPRFVRHDWSTLQAAARAFARVFPGPADSICLLPLWHVGGLMQAVRARVTKGRLRLADWDSVRSGTDRPIPDGFFLSLVPTQLERLMREPAAMAWLKGFRAIFVGGGPADRDLLERARVEEIPLAPAYGMTETAAQVSVLQPEEFLAGRSGVGRALPHAVITIVNDEGQPVAHGEVGRIQIEATSVCCSCSQKPPETRTDPFLTRDLGRMDADGFLTVIGRVDDVIITGGEKVWPGEVEAAIKAAGLAADAAVFGRPDDRWGSVVCAVLAGGSFVDPGQARDVLRAVLPAHMIPHLWARVERLPRNRMGKLDRARLTEMIDTT